MIDADEVFRRLRELGPQLRERELIHLAVFGSVGRGEVRENSDVDVLIKLDDHNKSFDTLMDIKFVLEDRFPETTVDLVLEDALKPAIRDRILSEARDVQPSDCPTKAPSADHRIGGQWSRKSERRESNPRHQLGKLG